MRSEVVFQHVKGSLVLFQGVNHSTFHSNSFQYCDTVGRATGRASSLRKVGCWFVDRDNITGAMHVL